MTDGKLFLFGNWWLFALVTSLEIYVVYFRTQWEILCRKMMERGEKTHFSSAEGMVHNALWWKGKKSSRVRSGQVKWISHYGAERLFHWTPISKSFQKSRYRAYSTKLYITHWEQWIQSLPTWLFLTCWSQSSDNCPGILWDSHYWELWMFRNHLMLSAWGPDPDQSLVHSLSTWIWKTEKISD